MTQPTPAYGWFLAFFLAGFAVSLVCIHKACNAILRYVRRSL